MYYLWYYGIMNSLVKVFMIRGCHRCAHTWLLTNWTFNREFPIYSDLRLRMSERKEHVEYWWNKLTKKKIKRKTLENSEELRFCWPQIPSCRHADCSHSNSLLERSGLSGWQFSELCLCITKITWEKRYRVNEALKCKRGGENIRTIKE